MGKRAREDDAAPAASSSKEAKLRRSHRKPKPTARSVRDSSASQAQASPKRMRSPASKVVKVKTPRKRKIKPTHFLPLLPAELFNEVMSVVVSPPAYNWPGSFERIGTLLSLLRVDKTWRAVVLKHCNSAVYFKPLVYKQLHEPADLAALLKRRVDRAAADEVDIKTLTVDRVSCGRPEAIFRVLGALKKVEDLTHNWLYKSDDWLQALHGLQTLKTLTLIRWNPPDAMGIYPAVRRIVVRRTHGVHISSYLNRGNFPAVKTLALGLDEPVNGLIGQNYSPWCPAPQATAVALQSKTVFPFFSGLVAVPSLKHLHLSTPISSLATLLAGVETNLTTLTITANPSTADDALLADPQRSSLALDQATSAPCLSTVATFVLVGTHGDATVQKWYLDFLAKMEEKSLQRDKKHPLKVATLPDDVFNVHSWYPASGQHSVPHSTPKGVQRAAQVS